MVPVAQALGLWAEEITCREWEREPPRKGRSRRIGQRAQQPRRDQVANDSEENRNWGARRDSEGRDGYSNMAMGWDNDYLGQVDGDDDPYLF